MYCDRWNIEVFKTAVLQAPSTIMVRQSGDIVVVEVVVVVIEFKGTIRDFLQSPHCVANCLHHVRSSDQCAIVCKVRANHRALVTCNMSCCVQRGTRGQLSY